MNSLGSMMRVRGLRHRPKEPAAEVHEEEVLVHGITKGPGTHGKCSLRSLGRLSEANGPFPHYTDEETEARRVLVIC